MPGSVDLADRLGKVIARMPGEQIGSAKAHPRVEYRVAPAEASGLAVISVDNRDRRAGVPLVRLDRFHAEVRRVPVPSGPSRSGVWIHPDRARKWIASPSTSTATSSDRTGRRKRVLVEEGYRTIPFPYEEITPPPSRWRQLEPRTIARATSARESATNATSKPWDESARKPTPPTCAGLGAILHRDRKNRVAIGAAQISISEGANSVARSMRTDRPPSEIVSGYPPPHVSR